MMLSVVIMHFVPQSSRFYFGTLGLEAVSQCLINHSPLPYHTRTHYISSISPRTDTPVTLSCLNSSRTQPTSDGLEAPTSNKISTVPRKRTENARRYGSSRTSARHAAPVLRHSQVTDKRRDWVRPGFDPGPPRHFLCHVCGP